MQLNNRECPDIILKDDIVWPPASSQYGVLLSCERAFDSAFCKTAGWLSSTSPRRGRRKYVRALALMAGSIALQKGENRVKEIYTLTAWQSETEIHLKKAAKLAH